ncbi:ExeM/NucH family extracellular endonuclease [Agromyces intestinalis]|uniref:ExeM/NucH family extracellular endonuclease n=1 Tax=Agromyces intestinalis TaxID=2592652 RepID=UPI001FE7553D|nr:ExeM/NucH family extracellular endonuclease [Agromyces intestinalis]
MQPFARGVTATLATAALAAVGVVVPVAAATAAAPPDLFISEVIEGSSNNKAVEVFNPTGEPIALDGVSLQMFFNGSASAGLTIPLTGTVTAGDVFVVAHGSSSAPILAQADLTNGAGWFNGDDAIVLTAGGAVIDSFGQTGVDPGTEWGTGVTSTADNTLRRKASVCEGDTNPADAFDPAIEWDGFAIDTFDGLGAHTADCGDVEPPIGDPVVNEFSASTAGTDVEYVELLGTPNADLSGFTLLEIEGDAPVFGVVDEVVSFGIADADGRALVTLPANALENGTLSLLLVTGTPPALGADLDADDDGVIDEASGLTIVDSVAVNDGGAGDVTYGPVTLGVAYDGQPFAPGGASRIPDGTDTDATGDWVRNDFDLAGIPGNTGTLIDGEAVNTPGAVNSTELDEGPGPIEADCDAPTVTIGSVQGAGAATPLATGTQVEVEGVVVGDFQTGGFDGYYLQDAGDGDAATSDGIFVFAPGGADVVLGDTVHVVGTVSEFFGMTEVTAVAASVCATGGTSALPARTELTLPLAPADRERFEGMRVTLPQTLSILETFEYGQFGLITLGTDRQYQPTAIFEPGSAEAVALAAANVADSIGLDDGRGIQNPDPALHPNGEAFTLDNAFRAGDHVTAATGVLDYRFDQWSVQPTQPAEFASVLPRESLPDVGGDLRVASFNVLNYFTDLDLDVPGTDFRGANTAEEFERQEAKIVAAITEIDADVVGLIEIQNNNDGAALDTLVAALNEQAGAGTYAAIRTGTLGTDAITTALVYQSANVTPTGAYAVLDSSVDPRFDTSRNRPALAQTFTSYSTGEAVTVVLNHLKSKGSACSGDPDRGDGQGNCNLTRVAAAEAIVDWLAGDPTGQGTVGRELIIGDLNSYDHEDPIEVLTGAGYTDLEKQFTGEEAYSYVFDGQLGYLDYALAGTGLVGDVTGASAWHINSDEPSIIDYDMTFKQPAQDALFAPDPYRSSDHDPIVVGIRLTPPDTTAPTLTVTANPAKILLPTLTWRTVNLKPVASDDSGQATVSFVKVTTTGKHAQVRKISDTKFEIRAMPGTSYTFEYRATDAAGNTTTATARTDVGTVRDLIETILDWLFG